jgi:hypothetical protein
MRCVVYYRCGLLSFSRTHEPPPHLSGWTRSLVVGGGLSFGDLALRLLFLLAPATIDSLISGVVGIAAFGTVAISPGVGLALIVWRT